MKFAFSAARDGGFKAEGLRPVFEYRDLGIGEATSGKFHAQVLRAAEVIRTDGRDEGHWHTHDLDFQMVYVLRGHVVFEYEGQGRIEMGPGDAVHQPPGIKHRLIQFTSDLELLEITSPAEFATTDVDAPSDAAA